jgi:Tfp pilus assembly protein PilN
MKYKINLFREIQRIQRETQVKRIKSVGVVSVSFGLLGLAMFFTVLQIFAMKASVAEERRRLDRIQAEYQRYRTSMMIVNKSDIENLDKIQGNRIFWTRVLFAMARYLPASFWITRFEYEGQALTVEGYGYITPAQQQLIILDDYLNTLRADPQFGAVFKQVYLNSAIRNDDEDDRARVSFSFTGVAAGGK